MSPNLRIVGVLTGLLAVGTPPSIAQPDTRPAAAPTSQPAAPPGAPTEPPPAPAAHPEPVVPEAVNELLDKLEHSADDLTAFVADVTYQKWELGFSALETRVGHFIYQISPQPGAAPTKRIAITFDKLYLHSRVVDLGQRFVFDGGWLAEIDPVQKQFIKRRIVAPGKQFDPLKLGEGPFPLPLGQAKKDVLARFDVQPAEQPKEGILSKLESVQGIRLTPKPGTREARDYATVDLFYDTKTLLPLGIDTRGAQLLDDADPNSRERKTILLRNVQRNPALTKEQEQELSIVEPDPQVWAIQVVPWRDDP